MYTIKKSKSQPDFRWKIKLFLCNMGTLETRKVEGRKESGDLSKCHAGIEPSQGELVEASIL